jgi:uncharacterized membrane protein
MVMNENEQNNYSKIRSLKKTISWRVVATLITGTIVFLFTRKFSEATYITLTSAVVLTFFYYIHERIWRKF